jgi:hypothetical protein
MQGYLVRKSYDVLWFFLLLLVVRFQVGQTHPSGSNSGLESPITFFTEVKMKQKLAFSDNNNVERLHSMVKRKFWGAMVVSSSLVYGTTILKFVDLERSWSWLAMQKEGTNWFGRLQKPGVSNLE